MIRRRIAVTLTDGNGVGHDFVVDHPPEATIGQLAEVLGREFAAITSGPQSLRPAGGSSVLPRDARVSSLGSGDSLALVPAQSGEHEQHSHLVLEVQGSPGEHPLRTGENLVGRGATADVALRDTAVSRRHCLISVRDGHDDVLVVDLASANGTALEEQPVERAVMRIGQRLRLGDTQMRLAARPGGRAAVVGFTPSPWLVPRFAAEEHPVPELPRVQSGQPFPLVMLFIPVLLGASLFVLTQRLTSLAFVAVMPAFVVGMWLENRRRERRRSRSEWERFAGDLDELKTLITARQDRERQVLAQESPSTESIACAIRARRPPTWSRNVEDTLAVRVGTGAVASRVSAPLNHVRSADPRAWSQLRAASSAWEQLAEAPFNLDLGANPVVAIAGAGWQEVLNALVVQIAGLHDPNDLRVTAVMSSQSAGDLAWLKWLPHTWHDGRSLVRTATQPEVRGGDPELVIVAGTDIALRDVCERHPGSVVLFGQERLVDVHAGCDVVLACHEGAWRAMNRRAGRSTPLRQVERMSAAEAEELARSLAGLVPAVSGSSQQFLPDAINYLDLVGPGHGTDEASMRAAWQQTSSAGPVKLRGVIGCDAAGPLVIELATQGPHALVAGTTGAGKSELLQTWIASLASRYSPQRVTFLLIDYKGGSAFAGCVDLPHCVGLVTDLSPELVHRALLSLEAEIRWRERTLAAAGLKSLAEAEEQGHPVAMPHLLVVVDEFAALTQEVPEFMDGVINVAQRGRSLGLHLILATQRPAGTVRENVRANTNLRIALRMAQDCDSVDVVGDPVAARLPLDRPGRAVLRVHTAPPVVFQTAHVGGSSTLADDSAATIRLAEFGPEARPAPVNPPPVPADGTDDLTRIRRTAQAVWEQSGAAPPRRPWLEPLPDSITLAELPHDASIGIVDSPRTQELLPLRVRGNTMVVGAPGSGRTTTLSTIAHLAGRLGHGVYGLDFGSAGLCDLSQLPAVGAVVNAGDEERIERLFAMLTDRLDRVHGANRLGGSGPAPVWLLIDGWETFRTSYEGRPGAPYDRLLRIAAQGSAAGIHIAVAALRAGSVPASLATTFSHRIALRPANDNDAVLAGVRPGQLPLSAPPGRAVYNGLLAQVAYAGIADDADSSAGRPPPIPAMPQTLDLGTIPPADQERVVIGLDSSDLAPVGYRRGDALVISGPRGSGRSTALSTCERAFERQQPDGRVLRLELSAARSGAVGPRRCQHRYEPCSCPLSGPDQVLERGQLLRAHVADTPDPCCVSLAGLERLLTGETETVLLELVRTALRHEHTVLVESDLSAITGSIGLGGYLRSRRQGLLLRPERGDAEALFRADAGRVDATRFPVGRGLLIDAGRCRSVQVAVS